jgi:TolB-like protein
MSFWKELSRRNVIKVGIAYAIVAWLIIHPVDIIFPTLHLPEWTTTFVTALFIIAFPFVLIFSWVYEITPKGLKKTKDVPVSKSITHLTGKRLNYIIMGLLVVAVAYLLFDKYFISHGIVDTKQVPAVSETVKAKKTIAVLPFEDDSPNADQGYFVNGLSEEILNTLAKIPDLGVTARTSSFSFKGKSKTIQEIASVLGVDNILEGSVRKAGNSLRITTQLIRAKDGLHLWSNTYDRELKDIFTVQEDIAKAVANELKATLGIGKSLKQLGGTDNEKAYELYLVAKGQQFKNTYNTIGLESIDTAITLDPKFALAWALKATLHILNTVSGPANQADKERDAGLRAVQKAIELEPNLAAAYVSLGYIKMNKGEWIEAESAFRKALQLPTESISADEMVYIFLHYIAVGNFKRALELIEETRRKDPLNANIRWLSIFTLNQLGDTQRADEEYERGRELFGDQWIGSFYLLSIISPGVKMPVSPNLFLDEMAKTREGSSRFWAIALEYFESPEKGLIELRRIYDAEENLSSAEFNAISEFAAYLGDPEFAMDALEKGYKIDASGAWHLWLPVRREVRHLSRFKVFVKKIGLVDYWNKFGWPDICHKLDNGDFVCD